MKISFVLFFIAFTNLIFLSRIKTFFLEGTIGKSKVYLTIDENENNVLQLIFIKIH